MNYTIVAVSSSGYKNTCDKLSLEVSQKIADGYAPHGNMNISYDNQKFLWYASQAMILVK